MNRIWIRGAVAAAVITMSVGASAQAGTVARFVLPHVSLQCKLKVHHLGYILGKDLGSVLTAMITNDTPHVIAAGTYILVGYSVHLPNGKAEQRQFDYVAPSDLTVGYEVPMLDQALIAAGQDGTLAKGQGCTASFPSPMLHDSGTR